MLYILNYFNNFANFHFTCFFQILDEWDTYDNIPNDNWTTIQEWEQQFSERYEFVGNLVKEVIEKEEDSFEKIEETKDNQNEL